MMKRREQILDGCKRLMKIKRCVAEADIFLEDIVVLV